MEDQSVEGHDQRTQQTERQPSTKEPQAEEVHDTSAGASISARNEQISTYRSDKSTLDGESCDVHTQQATSHNSN